MTSSGTPKARPPYAWSGLGAVSQVASRVELMTYVTCPTRRYVNADLPTTAGFAGASQFVRPEDVADSIPCGPDLDAIVEAVSHYWQPGFTDIALVQVGGDSTAEFLDTAAEPLLAKLRDAAPSAR